MLDKVVLAVAHLDLTMVEQLVMVHRELLEEVYRKPEVVPVVEEVEVMQVTEDKVMVVVQNATVNQFARSFKQMYPTARILAPSERQRSASERGAAPPRRPRGAAAPRGRERRSRPSGCKPQWASSGTISMGNRLTW
jgi:hypothetical protein